MTSRQSRKKKKQQRHQIPSAATSSQVELEKKEASSIASRFRNKGLGQPSISPSASTSKKSEADSPLNAAGVIDWSLVKIPFPDPPALRGPAPILSANLSAPAISIILAIIFTFGIIMTGRWLPIAIAVLAAILLFDRAVRDSRQLLIRIAASIMLSLICLPLINGATSDLTTDQGGPLGAGIIIMFSAALFLLGGAARRAAGLQDNDFRRNGLYSIGLACQILCFVMLALGAVLLSILLLALL